MIARREFLASAIAAAIATTMTSGAHAASADKALKRIRERVGGRLGVHALDSQSGKRWGLDENSRYAMGSTFKLPLAAALLWQVDRKAITLEHSLAISKTDLLPMADGARPAGFRKPTAALRRHARGRGAKDVLGRMHRHGARE